MDSPENAFIRIPHTIGQKFWLAFFALLAAGFAIAALAKSDSHFLIGIPVLIFPGSWVGYWFGRSPGRIEFASEYSYFICPRGESFSLLYQADRSERDNLPESTYLQLSETGFRWSENRLEIITANGAIFLGSGEKMVPIRDWLVRHGMGPK